MPSAGFEPAIPALERLQTYTLDCWFTIHNILLSSTRQFITSGFSFFQEYSYSVCVRLVDKRKLKVCIVIITIKAVTNYSVVLYNPYVF
jgi:hypothetical protein